MDYGMLGALQIDPSRIIIRGERMSAIA